MGEAVATLSMHAVVHSYCHLEKHRHLGWRTCGSPKGTGVQLALTAGLAIHLKVKQTTFVAWTSAVHRDGKRVTCGRVAHRHITLIIRSAVFLILVTCIVSGHLSACRHTFASASALLCFYVAVNICMFACLSASESVCCYFYLLLLL